MNIRKVNGDDYPILPERYKAYVDRTNEKEILKVLLAREFLLGNLSIRPGDKGKRVLDLGCGIGALTTFLAQLFKNNDIVAIDRSKRILNYAEKIVSASTNVELVLGYFEDFSRKNWDFILCSHVLQYIDSDLKDFIKKIWESLRPGGETWIILQEQRGINQFIRKALPVLSHPDPHFLKWFVHDHVRKILDELGIPFTTGWFRSFFWAPNFKNPSPDDLNFLNFLLLGGFEPENTILVSSLDELKNLVAPKGFVPHDVGVTRIRK